MRNSDHPANRPALLQRFRVRDLNVFRIGGEMMVNHGGTWYSGGLSDYTRGYFRTTLYLGGHVVTVRNSDVLIWNG